MPATIEDQYYSIGGNRHSAAADWSTSSGLLAFGADQSVATWAPLNDSGRGIQSLLSGHSAKVTAVKFLTWPEEQSEEILVTGSANGEVLVWERDGSDGRWKPLFRETGHDGTVNTIAILSQSNIFATGGADAKVKVWRVGREKLEAVSELALKPRFMPLALVLGPFASTPPHDTAVLAVAGTRNDIQVYSVEGLATGPQLKLCATLSGHEAWVRSLSLTPNVEGGFLLASASQDKYVRLWRFQPGASQVRSKPSGSGDVPLGTNTLTAKVQTVSAAGSNYSITFEALLLGHEDWVYSATWSPTSLTPKLLTASADGSLSVWESDPASGIWISVSRLGEISGQKGATTATGSAGGFWTGMWSPDSRMVTCLGRTGSWRLWEYDEASDFWNQRHAISGHVTSVNGICWSPDGGYLLSTSSDQTTRLHAEWKRGEKRSWHEFSRPQIHGYDLNCIASTTQHQFASGADEKLLRVFNEPKDIASMLHRLCQVPLPHNDTQLPDTAAIPVLGLSNKAIADSHDMPDEEASATPGPDTEPNGARSSLLDIQEPPTEDLLARHTLWPEHEKLYGHGYEISETAAPADGHGGVLATACKASSIDHAVIRLYDTHDWNEIKPPLTAHSLTVTRLAFSPQPPGYLLSVGRDRQWAVFQRPDDDSKHWARVAANPKAHSRMILDATWLANPRSRNPAFVTAGRDKVVRLWFGEQNQAQMEFTCRSTVARKSAVTAIAATTCDGPQSVIAVGEDDGSISVHVADFQDDSIGITKSIDVERHLCPSRTVNRLAWRPPQDDSGDHRSGQLAVASADSSVRILKIDWAGFLDD